MKHVYLLSGHITNSGVGEGTTSELIDNFIDLVVEAISASEGTVSLSAREEKGLVPI